MSLAIKIKEDHKNEVVAFGSNALPLSIRPDLLDFAIMVRETNHYRFTNFFEQLPSLEELKKMKVESELPVLSKLAEPIEKTAVVKPAETQKENQK